MLFDKHEIEYPLSIFKTARLLKRASPIVLLRYDFIRRRPLNDRSAEHDVAGIVPRILATDTNTGSISESFDDLITSKTVFGNLIRKPEVKFSNYFIKADEIA